MGKFQFVLTDRELGVLNYIKFHISEFGFQPSQEEIASKLKLSQGYIQQVITSLYKKGFVFKRNYTCKNLNL